MRKLIVFFLLFFLCRCVGYSQNEAITLFHSQGLTFVDFRLRNEIQPQNTDEILEDINRPWISSRTKMTYSFNRQRVFHYSIGIDHHRKITQYKFIIDPEIDRQGILREFYNNADNVSIVNKRNFVSLPLGVNYFVKSTGKINPYCSFSLKPTYYYSTINLAKGFDSNNERVYLDLKSARSDLLRQVNLVTEIGIGAGFDLSNDLKFIAEVNSDYSIFSVRKSSDLILQKLFTVNFGVGLTYILEAHSKTQ